MSQVLSKSPGEAGLLSGVMSGILRIHEQDMDGHASQGLEELRRPIWTAVMPTGPSYQANYVNLNKNLAIV